MTLCHHCKTDTLAYVVMIEQVTGLDARTSRVNALHSFVALLLNIIYWICFWKPLFDMSHHYGQISPYCVMQGPHTLMIKYAYNNDDKNNNEDEDEDDLPVDSPHKGPIMLSLDVTFVESRNNSRVSGDLRCQVPHITSLWCDTCIFMQHRHICIVESSYE